MKGSTAKAGETPVVFSHWVHRVKHTCRVCHGELDFAMKANETGVVCDKGKMTNRYCTVCHNGKIAFATKDAEGITVSAATMPIKILTEKNSRA